MLQGPHPSGRDVLGRRIAMLALGALIVAATLTPAAGAAAGASSACETTVPADDVTALQAALSGADTGCALWTVRVSGTYTLTAALIWVPAVPLHLVGPVGGTARIEADIAPGAPGHRLLTAGPASDPEPITLERLVLAGGDVSNAPTSGPGTELNRDGGAVLADDLTLIDVELIDNRASVGGGVSTIDLTAIRTSFVDNRADVGDPSEDTALGGAVAAFGDVVLENVTFVGNLAKSGGALHLFGDGGVNLLSATFVTFLANTATTAGEGSHVHVDGAAVIALRGVLLGPLSIESDVAATVTPAGLISPPACGGDAFAAMSTTTVGTFSIDGTCGAAATAGLTDLTFERVAFLSGTTQLWQPAGTWSGLRAVACDGGWPAEDQRGLERPQGGSGKCDAGAVERLVTVETEEPEEELEEQRADESVPVGPAPVGPVPTGVPAGEGPPASGPPTVLIGLVVLLAASVALGRPGAGRRTRRTTFPGALGL